MREFQALYADAIPVVDPADVDRDSVRRLILVNRAHANRLGDLGDLCGRPGVQAVAFDHHAHPATCPPFRTRDVWSVPATVAGHAVVASSPSAGSR